MAMWRGKACALPDFIPYYSMLTDQVQVLLAPEQRKRLEGIARRRDISLGALVREALDAYLARPSRSPSEALATLEALEAPIDDWPTMKEEIARGALG